MDRIERTFFAASTILILFIALPATAQVRFPYKLPEMIELEPTFESEIVVPNFTVLELNGAYEISIGANLDLVTGAAGFDYEVDMEAETYTISALDPMDVVARFYAVRKRGYSASIGRFIPEISSGHASVGRTKR